MSHTDWYVEGIEFGNCNCVYGCPCQFEALPTDGHCEGFEVLRIDRGRYGDVKLDGLNVAMLYAWRGPIFEGKGQMQVVIDERANAGQRAAIQDLLGGQIGGPWGILGWTWPTVHGPFDSSYELTLDGVNTRMKCGSYVEVEGE